MKAIFFINEIIKKFPLLLFVTTLLLFITSLIDAASIVSLLVIIDSFLSPTFENSSPISQKIIEVFNSMGLPTTLGWLLTVFLIFNVLKVSFQIFSMHSIIRTKYVLLRDIMINSFSDFLNSSWYFFSSGKQGTLLNTFIREISIVGDAFTSMGQLFAAILQMLLYLVVPLCLSWQVTTVIIISALLISVPFHLFGKVNYKFGKLNTATANEMTKAIHEGLSFAKIILGFGNQHKAVETLEEKFDAHRRATVKSQTLNYAIPFSYYPFGLLVLIVGLLVSRRIALPLSETIVLFYSLMRTIPLIAKITEQKASLDTKFPSYEQILQLSNRANNLKLQSGTKEFRGFSDRIVAENLSFGYPNHQMVLDKISLIIPKGKMIAIVGNSGAGKSTFIDMIMRFHEPRSGRILIDGVDLKSYDIKSYRQQIGYVPQDSILFNMSVKDNLLWSKNDATDVEIKVATQQAYANEFISKLPHGYDTLVGDRGVRLSGGQIQRIALARAILRKPALLILDEATSALDTYSERLIQQAIENIAQNTTVIVVAHRLSTIQNAHYIYLLKDGRVVEEGTYSDLVRRSGHFGRMVSLQSLEKVS
ncbi:ABC transporter ATP-binding protein [Candidatus Omnitrophota bacterium]